VNYKQLEDNVFESQTLNLMLTYSPYMDVKQQKRRWFLFQNDYPRIKSWLCGFYEINRSNLKSLRFLIFSWFASSNFRVLFTEYWYRLKITNNNPIPILLDKISLLK